MSQPTAASSSQARALAEEVLRAEARAVRAVADCLDPAFDEAVDRLHACRGNVIASGMGKSGLIARKVSATLASTGTPSHFLHPSEAMHGDLGRIRADDLVLILSYGGQTDEVLALAALVRQDRVPVVSITGRADNHLARNSDVVLTVGDVTEACPLRLAPTASTTAMLALGDALALAVSARRAFSADDFHRRHPGGALGRLLSPIVDAMRLRAGDNLPLHPQTTTVGDLVRANAAARRRVGATLLVDAGGRLAGILTDADVVKLIAREGPAVLERHAADVMTRNPRTLTHTALVRDAVQLARELRLDEIPIVDDHQHPVGMIDVQDLVGMRVIDA